MDIPVCSRARSGAALLCLLGCAVYTTSASTDICSELPATGCRSDTPLCVGKAFAQPTMAVGDANLLTITINRGTVPLHDIVLVDVLPAGLVFSPSTGPAYTTTCPAGTIVSFPLSGGDYHILDVEGLDLTSRVACTITTTVVAQRAGQLVNLTNPAIGKNSAGDNISSNSQACAAVLVNGASSDTPFQVTYAPNLSSTESYINIVNDGANGAPLLGPGFGGASGNICANVYAFSPDEQLVACCSCLVTPNALVNLGVNRDLNSKTLTGVIPTSMVVKIAATLAGEGGTATTCTNSAAMLGTGTLVPGILAWATAAHASPPGPGFSVTETAFRPATLSEGERASISGRCASILGNGSGYGICRSCQTGAFGGRAN